MEGDALQVVDNLRKASTDWSQGGLLIDDPKRVVNPCTSCSISNVKSESNKVAYSLARNALLLHGDLHELEETPNCIFPLFTMR